MAPLKIFWTETAIRQRNYVYEFDKQKIIIVGFWDNRQDPNKLLKLLQNR